jgi:hypothetical protein
MRLASIVIDNRGRKIEKQIMLSQIETQVYEFVCGSESAPYTLTHLSAGGDNVVQIV